MARRSVPKAKARYEAGLRRALDERAREALRLWEQVLVFGPDGDADTPHAPRTEVEIEAVHDMRVASKRSREMLRMMRDAGCKGGVRKALRDVDEVNDALGHVRELDVTIQLLESELEHAPPEEHQGLKWLIDDRKALRHSEFAKMREALQAMGREALEEKIQRVVKG